ncbi:MAG: YhcH/YjgK/YiaL family protein [Spirochaetota bacterium]
MIVSTIDDLATRYGVSVSHAVDFLRTVNASTRDGEYPIDGKDMFARIMTAKTEPREKRFYETHRNYIDVQYVFEGRQIIEWLPRSAFKEEPYDAAADVIKYTEHPVGTGILMGGATVAIFYPEDAHRPLCMYESPAQIRVCVVKVKCS